MFVRIRFPPSSLVMPSALAAPIFNSPSSTPVIPFKYFGAVPSPIEMTSFVSSTPTEGFIASVYAGKPRFPGLTENIDLADFALNP